MGCAGLGQIRLAAFQGGASLFRQGLRQPGGDGTLRQPEDPELAIGELRLEMPQFLRPLLEQAGRGIR